MFGKRWPPEETNGRLAIEMQTLARLYPDTEDFRREGLNLLFRQMRELGCWGGVDVYERVLLERMGE